MNKLNKLADSFEKYLSKISKEEWSDHIPGGLADNNTPKDFDSDTLEKGMKVEMEHTDDPEIAKEITMDHLVETEDYYTFLEHMEHIIDELKDKE